MTIARHYVMTARDGMGDAMRDALVTLAEHVRPLPGCEGIEMLRDADNPHRFIFIEKWTDADAHKAASSLLDQSAFGGVMGAIAGAPDGCYAEVVTTR